MRGATIALCLALVVPTLASALEPPTLVLHNPMRFDDLQARLRMQVTVPPLTESPTFDRELTFCLVEKGDTCPDRAEWEHAGPFGPDGDTSVIVLESLVDGRTYGRGTYTVRACLGSVDGGETACRMEEVVRWPPQPDCTSDFDESCPTGLSCTGHSGSGRFCDYDPCGLFKRCVEGAACDHGECFPVECRRTGDCAGDLRCEGGLCVTAPPFGDGGCSTAGGACNGWAADPLAWLLIAALWFVNRRWRR